MSRSGVITYDGEVVHEETRTVTTGSAIDASLFVAPEGVEPVIDPALAERGDVSHQYLQSFAAGGFPRDGIQLDVVATEIVGPGIFHITGGSQHSMAVIQDDGVVIIEAPLDETRTAAILSWLETVEPDKPVTHVVQSHHHVDHSGGLRSMAGATGATVIAGQAAVPLYQEAFVAESSVVPDGVDASAIEIVGVGADPVTSADPVNPVTVYALGAEEWRTTPSWPPAGIEETTLYLNGASKLTGEPPATKVVDRTTLHPRASTGKRNRWHTQLAKPVHYGDRSRADQLVMTWAAGTLSRPTEITGRPEARFRVRTEGDDLSLFVYLEAVDPRGRVLLLTEGMFRALHRAPRGLGVTYRRDDAVPVEPGVPMELIIRMLPVSVVLPAGWAIRMALAGADADTSEAADSPRDLEIHLEYDADDPATLTLPILRDRPI